MKKISIIISSFITLLFISCGTTSNVSNGNSAASQAGSSCGQVLASLHSQYKSSGKLDMTNSTTLLNVVELGTYYTALKSHSSDASYKTSFATGLISGSSGLITNSNSSSIINTLMSLSSLGSITKTTPGNAIEAVNAASGLVSLLKNL
jgi:hypothetical protein